MKKEQIKNSFYMKTFEYVQKGVVLFLNEYMLACDYKVAHFIKFTCQIIKKNIKSILQSVNYVLTDYKIV